MGHGVSTLTASTPRQKRMRREAATKTAMKAHAISVMALLYLSSGASGKNINPLGFDTCANTHEFSRRSNSSPAFALPPAPSGTTTGHKRKQVSPNATGGGGLITNAACRFNMRDRRHTCFHFYKDQTDFVVRKNNSSDFHTCPQTNLVPRENKDALLHRIINGRNSSSSRWRRRTRRAAAVLGIPRHCKDEQDYSHKQRRRRAPILKSSKKAANARKTEDSIVLRPVPPLSSTILNEQSDRLDLTKDRKRVKIETMNPDVFRPRLSEEQHSQAKLVWAAKYTSIHNLRRSFGSNRNKFWGDFDAKTTRKLYHTLLPRALLGLYEVGLWSPEEIAPLAFEARLAAKKYARERSYLPGRLAAMIYDGFRSWKTWGTWSVEGMTWEQIWHKYETQVLEEYIEDDPGKADDMNFDFLQEEITAQICLRILERSCITNEAFDRMLLDDQDDKTVPKRRRRRNAERELARIKIKLDRDIEELTQLQLLNHSKQTRKKAAIFAFSSPSFFLDILGGEFAMGSLTLSPQNFVKSHMVCELDNNEEESITDLNASTRSCATDIVRALVFPDLCE